MNDAEIDAWMKQVKAGSWIKRERAYRMDRWAEVIRRWIDDKWSYLAKGEIPKTWRDYPCEFVSNECDFCLFVNLENGCCDGTWEKWYAKAYCRVASSTSLEDIPIPRNAAAAAHEAQHVLAHIQGVLTGKEERTNERHA